VLLTPWLRCRRTHHRQTEGECHCRRNSVAWRRSRQRRGGVSADACDEALCRQPSRKGIKPPPGYKTSISICRKFLSDHAPRKPTVKQLGGSTLNRQAGTVVVRYEDRARKRRRHSRRGEGQLGCNDRVD